MSIRCRIGIHQWATWKTPIIWPGAIRRSCWRCGITEYNPPAPDLLNSTRPTKAEQ